jgi:hypothetical protein
LIVLGVGGAILFGYLGYVLYGYHVLTCGDSAGNPQPPGTYRLPYSRPTVFYENLLISPSTSPPKTYLQFRWTIVQEDSLTENFFVQSMTVLADIASVVEELQSL